MNIKDIIAYFSKGAISLPLVGEFDYCAACQPIEYEEKPLSMSSLNWLPRWAMGWSFFHPFHDEVDSWNHEFIICNLYWKVFFSQIEGSTTN
jgi:hypothetical protein